MFNFADIFLLLTLAFLEMLLSADNAIVLGVITHSLPPPLRRKALFIGVASAFVFRAAALLLAAYFLEYRSIQLLGGAYLLYLSIHFFLGKQKPPSINKTQSFWTTVLKIELFDLIFAIDSIVAGVAFIDGAIDKLWIVYVGGMIGLLGMRYAASFFTILLDRFPKLETSAYLIVGWIGVKLAALSLGSPLPAPLFWSVIAFLFLLGFFRQKR
jgi:YkoY family integral membrane protein